MPNCDDLPTINGRRITLRPLREEDAGTIFSIFSDPEVMRYWSTLPISEMEEARQMVGDIRQQLNQGNFLKWGIARCRDDLVIGTCTLFHVELDHHRAEVGYALGREFWGQGYMQEALNVLLNYSFNTLNLHRIEADVDPRNANSIKTLERLGFRREGYLRERWQVGGEIQDALFYGLLQNEWQSLPLNTSD